MKKILHKSVLMSLAVAAGLGACNKKDDDSPAPAQATFAENTIIFGDSTIVWDSTTVSTANNSEATAKEYNWEINNNYITVYTVNYDTIKVGTYNVGGSNNKRSSAESTDKIFVSFYNNADNWVYTTTDSSAGTVTISQVGSDKFVTFNDVELVGAYSNNFRTSESKIVVEEESPYGMVKKFKGKLTVKNMPFVIPPAIQPPIFEGPIEVIEIKEK